MVNLLLSGYRRGKELLTWHRRGKQLLMWHRGVKQPGMALPQSDEGSKGLRAEQMQVGNTDKDPRVLGKWQV